MSIRQGKKPDIALAREVDARPALPFDKTIEVRDACLCLHVQRTARALARRFDDVLRPLDLTSGQFSLLMSLNRPEPPTIGSVAELLAMDRTTLTANLKPLERRGLVTIAVDKQDKRSRRLGITPAGRALLAQAYPIWRETHTALEFKIAHGSADSLRKALMSLL
ncbi:MarR family winged helix-turn-helix transcriptional regulator [Undibacter mobilis]|uniref:MarR family transcriptional regulator n=1 Tax=Undibacter mobilis TaxID=2292256 RepID=A0A371BED6_9BRAD|nr:MarR family transcriptional regulator [Undibacter mobilis]RDV05721.1 MarR family transcriptional regulator [Undibacter mobilis]